MVNGTAACLCQLGYTGLDCQTGVWQEQVHGGDGNSGLTSCFPTLLLHPWP